MRDAEAPAPQRVNADVAGTESSASHRAAQQFPTTDSPVSHLNNALQILELLELDGPAQLRATTIGRAIAAVQCRITAAIDLLEPTPAQALEQLATMREALADMAYIERTNRELADLRLMSEGPAELLDDDRSDATGEA